MSGAWAVLEGEATDLPGMTLEAYAPTYPGSLPYDSAMAVFCLPDKTAFLQEVKVLNVDGRAPIYDAHFNETVPLFTTGKNRRLH